MVEKSHIIYLTSENEDESEMQTRNAKHLWNQMVCASYPYGYVFFLIVRRDPLLPQGPHPRDSPVGTAALQPPSDYSFSLTHMK